SATQSEQRRRKRVSRSPESEEYADGEDFTQTNGSSQEQMVKKLVRLALSCEYSRQPIRRVDIGKVLGGRSRQFKEVFDEAQMTLRDTFGMELVELPVKEKVTLQQRRAAQKSEKQATSSKSWVLQSTLPDKYRDPDIIPPPQIPSTETESAYVGLYTFIVGVIYLAGGTLPEAKLERYLRATNTETSTPIDLTQKLITRLIREGYIVRNRDNSSGEEVVEYMVGPRGKVEIGEEGVAGLVQTVYGEKAPDDLERRLERSLGL
ncbi:MAGE-domain-containing protein, partial [Rhizodiscina lignyota]